MINTIEYLEHENTYADFQDIKAYEFRKDRPLKYLQKVCCFILHKIGAYHIKKEMLVTRRVITDEFMEQIFRQVEGIESYFGRKPTRILIGAFDYKNLMNEDHFAKNIFTFNTQYNHGLEIIGLRVDVIPWMKGILVLPDLILQSPRPNYPKNQGFDGAEGETRTPTNI